MTDTGALIKAKAEAVNALATALKNAIAADQIQDLNGVGSFLSAWAAGVNAVVPAETASDQNGEPSIGTTVFDKDGDSWTRCGDGKWIGGRTFQEFGNEDWHYLQRWAPLSIPS